MASQIYSKRINVGGLDIHYFSGGNGDPLLIVHGGSEGARGWMNNIKELARNYTVYVPDLPGFGGSQACDGEYCVPELIDFVDEFARSVGLGTFYLMGHSLGGGIALSYALKFPDKVKKLVLVSSLFLGKEIAPWVRFLTKAFCRPFARIATGVFKVIKWLLKLVVRVLLVPIELVVPVPIASMYLASSVINLKAQATVLVNRLSEIMVPTLVVWGANDPIVPAAHAYAAAELIPDCRVKVFEDSGHSVYRERLTEFSELLNEFLG